MKEEQEQEQEEKQKKTVLVEFAMIQLPVIKIHFHANQT